MMNMLYSLNMLPSDKTNLSTTVMHSSVSTYVCDFSAPFVIARCKLIYRELSPTKYDGAFLINIVLHHAYMKQFSLTKQESYSVNEQVQHFYLERKYNGAVDVLSDGISWSCRKKGQH